MSEPAGQDIELSTAVLGIVEAYTGADMHELALQVAGALHHARTIREKELRGHLRALGSQANGRQVQLSLLNRAHRRTKERLRGKVADCEMLRRALIATTAYTCDQLAAMLRGEPTPEVKMILADEVARVTPAP
jgi:hypothetical protein